MSFAVHLTMQRRYRGFPKAQWPSLLPSILNDAQLQSLCGEVYEDLYAKSGHLFPLKLGKQNFQKLKVSLELENYYFNVIWCSGKDVITVYADAGKTNFVGVREEDKIIDLNISQLISLSTMKSR